MPTKTAGIAIIKMTRWDVASEALKHFPDESDKALVWAINFLNDHPALKVALVDPMLEAAMAEAINLTIRNTRLSYRRKPNKDYTPIIRTAGPSLNGQAMPLKPAAPVPMAHQMANAIMAATIVQAKAQQVKDWLTYKLTKGKVLGEHTRPELRKISDRYKKMGITNIVTAFFLDDVITKLPDDTTKAVKLLKNDELSAMYEAASARVAQWMNLN